MIWRISKAPLFSVVTWNSYPTMPLGNCSERWASMDVSPRRMWRVFRLLELGYHGSGAGIGPNGQHHGDRVSKAGRIHAFAICIECENVVTERHKLRLQLHIIDDRLK